MLGVERCKKIYSVSISNILCFVRLPPLFYLLSSFLFSRIGLTITILAEKARKVFTVGCKLLWQKYTCIYLVILYIHFTTQIHINKYTSTNTHQQIHTNKYISTNTSQQIRINESSVVEMGLDTAER